MRYDLSGEAIRTQGRCLNSKNLYAMIKLIGKEKRMIISYFILLVISFY